MGKLTCIKALIFSLLLAIQSGFVHAQDQEIVYLPLIKKSGLKDTFLANAYLSSFAKNYSICIDSLIHANPYLTEALNIYLNFNHYTGVSDAAHYLASNVSVGHNYAKALEYSFLSLKYAELAKDIGRASRVYRNIGLIYHSQRRWKEALDYFQKSVKAVESSKGKFKTSTAIYLSALCKIELHHCESAISDLDKALKLAVTDKDQERIYECHTAKGRAFSCVGRYSEAEIEFNLANEFYQKLQELNALSSIHTGLARLYLKNQNHKKALEYGLKAYDYNKRSNLKLLGMDITSLLAEIYQKLGDYKQAMVYMNEYNRNRDTMLNRDLLAEIAVSQAKYEFKKTEDRINQELKDNETKKKRANTLLVILGAFILLGSFAFYYVRRERSKSDALLLNILPKTTADELKEHGSALPKSHEAVSIMFCDVESFTKVSEELTAEEIVNMLNFYFSGFDKIVGYYNIEKIKTIGDAYMCVSGLQNEENHADNMVKAALDFHAFLRSVDTEITHKFGMSLNFRIGINSGSVVSGVVGSKKYAYDIWGDAVNIAARMEQTSEPGKINISENTYNLIKDKFITEFRGELKAKNKGELKMYFVKSVA